MWSINLSVSTTRIKASQDITFTTTYLENIYHPLKAGLSNPFLYEGFTFTLRSA